MRVAATIAVDAAPSSFQHAVAHALAAGATCERVVATLEAVTPVTGAARVVASAPKVALALGYDVEDALEELDPDATDSTSGMRAPSSCAQGRRIDDDPSDGPATRGRGEPRNSRGEHECRTGRPVHRHLFRPNAAQQDWDGIKQLARDGVITVDGLVLVSRDADGKIDVKDNAHDVGRGAALGAVGGAIIGLIFPPAFLASAAVGAGVGAGAGAIVDRSRRRRSRPTSKTSCRPAARASSPCSRSSGSRTSRRRSRRPTRSASTRSTAKAPSRSRRPRRARADHPDSMNAFGSGANGGTLS